MSTRLRLSMIVLLLAPALVLWLLWLFDAGQSRETLQSWALALHAWQSLHPLLFTALFMLVFAMVSALSIPGAAPLCLLAGQAFGVFGGALVLGVASTLGALLSFLAARHLAAGRAERLLAARLPFAALLEESRGAALLVFLRLLPVVPYPLLNPLLGMGTMPAGRFFWSSLVGLTLGSLPYTWAGESLGALLAGSGGGLPLAVAAALLCALRLGTLLAGRARIGDNA